MEKLKKLHFESLKDIGVDYVSKDEVAELSAKITTDVAVEFAEWCVKNQFMFYHKGNTCLWMCIKNQKSYTTEELFEKFINNHYGK